MTLTDFLRARLDEAYAAEVAPRRMRQEHVGVQVGTGAWPNTYELAGKTLTRNEFEDQYLEPAPDPRALAAIEAHRRIVALHGELVPWPTSPRTVCETCAENAEADYDGAPMLAWPCPTLRHLAAIYSDHPDYREEWKP